MHLLAAGLHYMGAVNRLYVVDDEAAAKYI